MKTNRVWSRSKKGLLAGVCESLALSLGSSPGLIRVLWLGLSIFLGGGILLYLLVVISIPREDELEASKNPRLLGVCSRVAHNFNLDVGLVRLLTLCLIPISLGGTLVFYFALNFIVEERDERPVN